jgi:hypothetical protein
MGFRQTKKLLHSKGNNQQWTDSLQNERKYVPIIQQTKGEYQDTQQTQKSNRKATIKLKMGK